MHVQENLNQIFLERKRRVKFINEINEQLDNVTCLKTRPIKEDSVLKFKGKKTNLINVASRFKAEGINGKYHSIKQIKKISFMDENGPPKK